MAITVTQITAFLAVYRGGSVTAAADALVVTQPSVSAAVGALGRELGCDLFERAGRGIRPTAAGEAFADYAADVLGLLEQGRTAAREASGDSARSLRIAAVTTAAESFVPLLMRAFSDEHPGIDLALDVGNRQAVVERVLAHSVDLAFSGRPPADDRLSAEPLIENAIVCITAPDDPLLGAGPVTAAALAERAWLLREPGSGSRCSRGTPSSPSSRPDTSGCCLSPMRHRRGPGSCCAPPSGPSGPWSGRSPSSRRRHFADAGAQRLANLRRMAPRRTVAT